MELSKDTTQELTTRSHANMLFLNDGYEYFEKCTRLPSIHLALTDFDKCPTMRSNI